MATAETNATAGTMAGTVAAAVSGYVVVGGEVTPARSPAPEFVGPPEPGASTGPVRAQGERATGPGRRTLPLLSITATFVLNEFPTAVIVIPVGQPAASDDEKTVVRARELAQDLQELQPISCYLRLSGEFAPNTAWPEEDICVFSGYVAGSAMTRTAQQLAVTVQATHWLMDLDASHVASDQIVPGSPITIHLPALGGNFSAVVSGPTDPDLDKILINVWKDGIKKKFRALCASGWVQTELACGGGGPLALGREVKNDVALRRLEPQTQDAFDLTAFADVPNLSIVDVTSRFLKEAVISYSTQLMFNTALRSYTMWTKLMEFAAVFQFSVVPLVNTAVCAPIMPTLAGEDPPRHATIHASEYYSFAPVSATYRVRRGVSLHGISVSPSGATVDQSGTPPDPQLGNVDYGGSAGCYLAEQDQDLSEAFRRRAARGALVFSPTPGFVENQRVMQAALSLPATLPTGGQMAHTMSRARPSETPAEETKKEEAEAAAAGPRLGDLYAKALYWAEHFRTRAGELVGKLRFDIAPGSIVRIEDVDGKLAAAADADRGYVFAHVTSVRLRVDAVNQVAETAFTLSHLRREDEKMYGVDRHPLYQDRWVGTVLQNVNLSGGPRLGQHEVE